MSPIGILDGNILGVSKNTSFGRVFYVSDSSETVCSCFAIE